MKTAMLLKCHHSFRTEIQCPTPSNIVNSNWVGNDYTYQGRVTYTCLTGFEETGGNNTIECTANGNWSVDGIVCTGRQSAIQNGFLGDPLAVNVSLFLIGSLMTILQRGKSHHTRQVLCTTVIDTS